MQFRYLVIPRTTFLNNKKLSASSASLSSAGFSLTSQRLITFPINFYCPHQGWNHRERAPGRARHLLFKRSSNIIKHESPGLCGWRFFDNDCCIIEPPGDLCVALLLRKLEFRNYLRTLCVRAHPRHACTAHLLYFYMESCWPDGTSSVP